MSFNNIVLIDTSYIYQRVTACATWCKKADKYFNDEMVYENFISSIKKLVKKTGVPVENMILCRDSWPIWRSKDYDKYKTQRKHKGGYGPHVKELYERISELFNVIIRIYDSEADDIIGILTFYFLKQNTQNHIYVVSNDKDFFQLPSLFKTKRVHLLDNSKFQEHDISGFTMHNKILKGDSSDNIKKLKQNYTILDYLRSKQLMDLSYSPRFIQDRIFSTGYFALNSNNKPLQIQLGFACINTELREKHIFCDRNIRADTVCQKGIKILKDIVKKNIKDLKKMVQWNYENGIRVMRISSELMPHYTNPKCPNYNMNFVRKDLEEIGRLARLYKIRLTFHPAQFNVLSTPSEEVFKNTEKDLTMHAEILDLMGMDQDSVMVIHGGGIYDDKEAAIKRFVKNFKRLEYAVQRRLVIENCEKCYNIEDMLRISKLVNAPVVFDSFHYNCYEIKCKKGPCSDGSGLKEAKEYIPEILETWKRRNIKPKFHVSEQRKSAKMGAHSDYVQCIPRYLLEIPDKYETEIDIMVEAKMKEKAVFKLYKKYPKLSPF